MNIALNRDCMEVMKEYPDGYFDLAVVDPPYGAGFADDGCNGWFKKYKDGLQFVHVERERERAEGGGTTDSAGGSTGTRLRFHGGSKNPKDPWNRYLRPQGTTADRGERGQPSTKKIIAWDVAPKQEYFEELFRVSRNQIIWGGNYFPLPPTRCFLIWRKLNIPLAGFSMAPVEYAWTSFNKNAAAFEAFSSANPKEPRFHPTQKPVSLYAWIYEMFAERGMKILDTHLGSGSSRLAAYDAGLDFVGCEIDKWYFDKQEERFAEYVAQESLFVDASAQTEQIGLWSDET